MKLKDKKIAFGLTHAFYTFDKIIEQMKDIVLEGGEIFPIMPATTSQAHNKYGSIVDFVTKIEEITGKKIINDNAEAERVEADIMVIAPCSRKPYCKTCFFYI